MAAPTRRKAEPWTIGRILHTYGLRITGGPLDIGYSRFQGGDAILDESAQAVCVVTRTDGYDLAEPVLKWVYAYFRPLHKFNPGMAQERFCRELWGIGPDFPIQRAATGHYWGFIKTLETSLKEHPFSPVLFEKHEDAA